MVGYCGVSHIALPVPVMRPFCSCVATQPIAWAWTAEGRGWPWSPASSQAHLSQAQCSRNEAPRAAQSKRHGYLGEGSNSPNSTVFPF